jgi:hypothetical protein
VEIDMSVVLGGNPSLSEISSRIEIRFGLPSSVEREELTNKRSIEFDVSFERVMCVDFMDLLNEVWMKKGRENLFELIIFISTGEKVICSDVSFDTYTHNGYKFPKIIIQSDYLNVKDSDRKIWLSDSIIDSIGKEIDGYFDFEYVDFLRKRT